MTHGKLTGLIPILTALAVVFTYTPGASAQEAPVEEVAPAPAVELTDEALETFAHAYVEVQAIGEEYQSSAPAAPTPEEAQALAERTDEQVTAVIEAHGLTVEEYTGTVQALNADPELQERFGRILERLSDSEVSGG